MARRGSTNGPTPSEFSFGRGSRPSLGLYPQPDAVNDQLALKRAQMQVDPDDPAAPLDFEGTYVGKDKFGRDMATMKERGYTPIVRETGRGEMDQRLDPMSPKLYEDAYGKGADPNESWRDGDVKDPIRRGWESDQYDPATNEQTTAYEQSTGENAERQSMLTSIRDKGKRLKIKRTPDAYNNGQIKHDGYYDPRADDMPWL